MSDVSVPDVDGARSPNDNLLSWREIYALFEQHRYQEVNRQFHRWIQVQLDR